MLKFYFSKLIWIFYYIFIFFYLLNNSFSYIDPDLGWHLKVGEEILYTYELPHIEHFDFSLEGQRWVDHEWLVNLVVFLIYSNFGYAALNIIFALIVVLSLFVLNKFTQKYFLKNNSGIFFIMVLQFLGVMAMRPHLGVRMQEITILFLLILIIIIHNYSNAETLKSDLSTKLNLWRDKRIRVLWLLPMFFYIWACMHAGFLIGFFVMFLWASYQFLEILIQKKIPIKLVKSQWIHFKAPFIFSIFACLSFLATLVTPYGIELYTYLSECFFNTAYLRYIVEWLPFYLAPIQYLQLLYAAFVAFSLGFIFYQLSNQQKTEIKNQAWYLILTVIFFFIFLKARRNFPLFFIISFPVLVAFFVDFFKLPQNAFKYIKNSLIIKFYLVTCCLLIILSQVIDLKLIHDPFVYFESSQPLKSVEFIKDNPEYLGKRTLVSYGWGGYLVWMLPENKLFVDGHFPQFTFRGHTILEEYFEFFQKGQARRKLNEHNVELVLLPAQKKQTELSRLEKYIFQPSKQKEESYQNYLKDYLDNSAKWSKVYEDKVSKIYYKISL